MEEFSGADEGDFLELLIANERIHKWLEELVLPVDAKRKKQLLLQLLAAVEERPAYAEEVSPHGMRAW